MKILVTGFTPFGGEKINPAYEAVKLLADEIEGATIVKAEVPTAFGESRKVLKELLEKEQPDAVLCVGQAGGRPNITVEKDMESGIQNNVIEKDGETAYFTTLPIRAMVKEMKDAGIPAMASYTAGTFVCNYLMYEALYFGTKAAHPFRAGFIHVPYATCQGIGRGPSLATMSLADMAAGLTAALRAIVKNETDIPSNMMRMGMSH